VVNLDGFGLFDDGTFWNCESLTDPAWEGISCKKLIFHQ